MNTLAYLAGIALLATQTLAHVEMVNPYPILSPQNDAVAWYNKNYDMMSPLKGPMSPGELPYPCKGYLWSTDAAERRSQKSWPAGSWQTLSFGRRGAPHKGGSCQLTLSYDYGETWQVIHSYIGGCMIEGWDWDFQVPSEAPSGEVVFSWNWFNHEGNREMYQNCAIITITNGGSGLNTRDFPPPFIANVNANGCSTIEGRDPVFPRPGRNVKWSGPYGGGWRPELGYGTTGSECVDWNAWKTPAGANGAGSEPAPAPAPAPSSSSTTSRWSEPTPSSESAAPASSTTTQWSSATPRPGGGVEYNAGPLSSSSSSAAASVAVPSAEVSSAPAPAPAPSPSPAPGGNKCTKRRRSLKSKKRHARRKLRLGHKDLSGLKRRHADLTRQAIEQIEARELGL